MEETRKRKAAPMGNFHGAPEQPQQKTSSLVTEMALTLASASPTAAALASASAALAENIPTSVVTADSCRGVYTRGE